MSRPFSFFAGFVTGVVTLLACLVFLQALPLSVPLSGVSDTATAEFGIDGTTCYAFKVPQADGLGEHLIFCKDGRYGIHNGAAFTPRLYPEENADGNAP